MGIFGLHRQRQRALVNFSELEVKYFTDLGLQSVVLQPIVCVMNGTFSFDKLFPYSNKIKEKVLTVSLNLNFFEELMVHLLESPFPLDAGVTKKVILVLRGVFFFLNFVRLYAIDLIFIVRIFFDLMVRRNKAKS